MVLNMRQFPPPPPDTPERSEDIFACHNWKVCSVNSVAQLCLTLCNPMDCNMPGFTVHHLFFFFCIELHELFPWFGDNFLTIFNSRRLLKLMPIESVMPSIKPTHPLSSLSSRLSIFPNIRVFCNKSVLCITWPKYWSFSISPFKEYSGLISFRMDGFDLHAVQGTLKSLLQHHSLKASVLQQRPLNHERAQDSSISVALLVSGLSKRQKDRHQTGRVVQSASFAIDWMCSLNRFW